MTGKALTAAIKAIANADRAELAQTIADLAQLGEFGKAEAGGRPVIDDAFNAYSDTPSEREVNPGPLESASGSGASRMIGHYSRPQAQHGVARAVEALAELVEGHGERLDRVEANVKAQLGLIGKVAENVRPDLAKAIADLIKAGDDKKEAEETEEEDESEKAAKAALAGSTILDGRLSDIFGALAGRGPVAKSELAEAAQNILDADDISLADRLRIGTLAARRAAGIA